MSRARLRASVDRAACRGAAVCTRRAPHTFSLDAERRAVAAFPPGDPDAALREAEAHCPNFAIRVEEVEEEPGVIEGGPDRALREGRAARLSSPGSKAVPSKARGVVQPRGSGMAFVRQVASAAALVSVALSPALPVASAEAEPGEARRAAEVERGRRVFQTYCASCHGPEGAGDGPAAAELDPAPRDFGSDPYRYGETKHDLFGLITNGAVERGGSPMMQPYGSILSEEDRWALVAFVWSLKGGDPE